MSKPQIILTAAGASITMAIAYRLANRMLDGVLPKKKVEEEEPADRRRCPATAAPRRGRRSRDIWRAHVDQARGDGEPGGGGAAAPAR